MPLGIVVRFAASNCAQLSCVVDFSGIHQVGMYTLHYEPALRIVPMVRARPPRCRWSVCKQHLHLAPRGCLLKPKSIFKEAYTSKPNLPDGLQGLRAVFALFTFTEL